MAADVSNNDPVPWLLRFVMLDVQCIVSELGENDEEHVGAEMMY